MNNDKKKTMLVAGLGLVLVAVGAFQFIPKKSPTPPATTTEEKTAEKTTPISSEAPKPGAEGEKKELDPQKEALLAMVSAPLPMRDPFAPRTTPQQEPAVTEPVTPVQPPVVSKPTGRRTFGGGRPAGMDTSIPPFDPTQGGGTLPAIGESNPGVNIANAKPLRQPSELAYEVKGVLVGDKPMAVFEDDGGNQRLVPLGGSLDRDSKVVGIEKGKVRIRHKGKDKTLRLPEGP